MTDIALAWSNDSFSGDLALDDGRLVVDEGLRTAIFASLFTDARAAEDDALPDEGADPRGWWGNAFAETPGRQLGSKLWLLNREKVTARTVDRVRVYAAAALAWLTEDRIVSALTVETGRIGLSSIGIRVVVARPNGPAREIYDFIWEASL